jgi:DNA recombination protein RmuC
MTAATISPWIWALLAAVGVAAALAWNRLTTRRCESGRRTAEGEASAARAIADEVRRQLAVESDRAERLTRQLADAERGRAVAETQGHELRANLDEQKRLLGAAEARLGDAFRSLAADALAANNQGFLTLAGQKLAAAHQASDAALDARQKAIESMVKPVMESLDKVDGRIREIEKERGHAYGRLTTLVQQMSSTQERLQSETGNLARALRAPAVRGRWGEIQLKRVVEIAGMVEHCDFTQQQTLTSDQGARLRPDMVVRLPGGRHLVVDSKVPLEAYLDALEAEDDDERRDRLAAHASQVRAHVLKLGGKGYWAGLDDSPEFVVMFLPSEAMYSAALEENPSLIEEGVGRRVLIATPTTLIALLQTVHFGWRQERLAENAREISEQGRVVHERLCTLVDHWARLGGALGRATEHFNAAVASFDSRVLPAVRKLEELGSGGSKDVAELGTVDTRPRPVSPEAAKAADC